MRSKVFRESLQMGRENGIAVCNFPFFLPTRHLPPSTFHPPTSTLHLTPSRRAGFSLLELLIVISIMITITTITVMNYYGAMRSAGFTAVSTDVFNALLMARQRACLDNKPVVFYLCDSTNYVIQEAYGTITKIEPPTDPGNHPPGCMMFWDQDTDQIIADTNDLINVDRPGVTAAIDQGVLPGYQIASIFPDTSSGMLSSNINSIGEMVEYCVSAVRIYAVPNGVWEKGDRYGMQIFNPQMLPNGFVFDPDPLLASVVNQRMVIFNPDGSINTDPTTGGISHLVVKETISGKIASFTIQPNGKVTQDQ